MMNMNEFDLMFAVVGVDIPSDHGYLLYSAVKKCIGIENIQGIGIHPVKGRRAGNRCYLPDRPRLIIRCGACNIHNILKLTGQSLRIGDSSITVGVPSIISLRPSPCLYSPLVVFKNSKAEKENRRYDPKIDSSPDFFQQHITKELAELGIKGKPSILEQPRVLSIKGNKIVGHPVKVSSLLPEDSLHLQSVGLGGRRAMGAGLFCPITEK